MPIHPVSHIQRTTVQNNLHWWALMQYRWQIHSVVLRQKLQSAQWIKREIKRGSAKRGREWCRQIWRAKEREQMWPLGWKCWITTSLLITSSRHEPRALSLEPHTLTVMIKGRDAKRKGGKREREKHYREREGQTGRSVILASRRKGRSQNLSLSLCDAVTLRFLHSSQWAQVCYVKTTQCGSITHTSFSWKYIHSFILCHCGGVCVRFCSVIQRELSQQHGWYWRAWGISRCRYLWLLMQLPASIWKRMATLMGVTGRICVCMSSSPPLAICAKSAFISYLSCVTVVSDVWSGQGLI